MGIQNSGPEQPKSKHVQQQPKKVPNISASNTASFQSAEEDLFILENLDTLSQSTSKKKEQFHFWIDPKIFNSENQKYENYLKKHIQLEGCSSIDGFLSELEQQNIKSKVKCICAASLKDQQYQFLQNNQKVRSMYLFCQNKQRAKLLKDNFPKIVQAKFDIVELKDLLVQQGNNDEGDNISTNVLLIIEEDANLMNKYRINFHSLTNVKSLPRAKEDFIKFAKKTYPESQKQINQFEKNYKLNLPLGESYKQAIFWLSRPGFFWQSTQTLPKSTTDPKKLAYLRFPFKQGYQAILNEYKLLNNNDITEVFLVMTPTAEELKKMAQNINNYLIFTTFVKGYKSERIARNKVKKGSNSYLVRVMLKLPPKINQALDFGYKIIDKNLIEKQDDPDMIFNIYNVFQIVQYEEDLKQFVFQYGSLAEVAYIRQKERQTRLNPFQDNLLKNYDYLQDIISRIDTQATILQMSGHFQDSLLIYSQRLEQVRKSQPSQQVLDKYTIQLGDAYRINQQFKLAEQKFLSIKEGKMALIAKVHLAELYFKSKQTEKLRKVIEQIEKNISKYKQVSNPDSFKAQNYVGMQLINRGCYKQASRLYKSLNKEICAYYDFKFEGIPLVHEINRNRALCETKLNNYGEALNLLGSTKEWQKVCEGNKSPGLLITENLIKNVYESRGLSNEAQHCSQEIKKIKQTVQAEDQLYLSRSGIFVDLNESLININLSERSNFEAPKNPKKILEQSAINIDL